MPTPTGGDTYRGLGVPLSGEYEQLQLNSSQTMVTLTHSTANAGAFLVGRNSVSSLQSVGLGSSLQSGVVFAIDAAGNYEGRSGTTVTFSFGPGGIEGSTGTTASAFSIDSSGPITTGGRLIP